MRCKGVFIDWSIGSFWLQKESVWRTQGIYESMKIYLIVKMISNSGSIPAGNVSFNIFAKQTNSKSEFELSLEKCPDKAATIFFAQSY
jgi:hypothetical protein